jgi:hypothetical protein
MLLITEACTVQKKAQNEDLVVTKQTSISNSFKRNPTKMLTRLAGARVTGIVPGRRS